MTRVKKCKGVWKVTDNAPLFTTRQFMIDNQIDVIIVGKEYKDSIEDWVENECITYVKYIPRTEGTSTSDIAKRVRENISDKR